jgi:hypothetical protein
MRLEMTVRRLRCDNPQCAQKTFVERFPDWLAVYARRTDRLTDVIRQVGFEVGGESGARVLNYSPVETLCCGSCARPPRRLSMNRV